MGTHLNLAWQESADLFFLQVRQIIVVKDKTLVRGNFLIDGIPL